MRPSKAQQRLIEENIKWARVLAQKFGRSAPYWCRVEFESAAFVGLVESARRWRKADGVQFRSFAQHRIRGACQDVMRATDTMSRHHRQMVNEGREVMTPVIVLDGKKSEKVLGILAAPPPDMDPLERREIWERFSRALRLLTDQQAFVAFAVFVLDLRLAAVGRRLGVTESRCCQILRDVERAMRPAFEGLGPRN